MTRKLGVLEIAQTLTGELVAFNVIAALRLRNGPSPEVLRQALDRLQEQHPQLRVGITQKGRGYEFTGIDGLIPLTEVDRSGDQQWQEVVEQELTRQFELATDLLLRCHYIFSPAGQDCELILTFHHTIIDGASGIMLCRQLLGLCAGAELPSEPGPDQLPPPTDQLFPIEYQGLSSYWHCLGYLMRQVADEISFRWHSRGRRQPRIDPSARCRVILARLTEAETYALLRRALAERVSVSSTINAAMLLAVHRHLYDGAEQPLRYFTMVDLRPHLRSPPPGTRLGSHFTMLRYTIGMDQRCSLWQLAEQIGRQVYAGLKRGEKFTAHLLTASMMRSMLRWQPGRMSTVATSFTGAFDLTVPSGPIEVVDLHAFVSNFMIGPEYTAQVRISGGELMLDIVYLSTDMDQAMAQAIADEMCDILRAGTRGDQ
jgi:hypothetical protein